MTIILVHATVPEISSDLWIEHLVAIERKHHPVIKQAIDEQLLHTPAAETRSRETLRQPDDDDLERLILAHSPRFQTLLEKSRRSIQSGKGLTSDEFWTAVKQRRVRKSKAKPA